MIRVLSEAEKKEHLEETLQFVRDNPSEMYNFMRTVKHIRWLKDQEWQDKMMKMENKLRKEK